MEILICTYSANDSCAFYRSTGVLKDLQKKLGPTANFTVMNLPIPAIWTLTKFDLVMLQRPFTVEALNLIIYLKAIHIPVWVDWDDDLFHLNPENPVYLEYANTETQQVMVEIIKQADIVTVPLEYLRQILLPINENIVIVPNALNDTLFSRRPYKQTNQIVWRGPENHVYDLLEYEKPIKQGIKKLKSWVFVFMGYAPWMFRGYKIQTLGMVDMMLYYMQLQNLAPAVLHVPLADNTFNRCRSNVAYLEATLAGAVTICPGWWDAVGSIKYDNQAEYFEALKLATGNDIDREFMAKMAYEYVQDCLVLSKVNEKRAEIIKQYVL